MPTYISLLRGINVGGQKKIKMDELKKLYDSLGFKEVKTGIQSGNVIFSSPAKDAEVLAKRVEQRIKEVFGLEVSVLIRTPEELQNVIKANPFANEDNARLYVTFLAGSPKNIPINEITNVKDTKEKFFIANKEIYLFCPNGYGKTKLSNAFFERKLKVIATTRNLKTIKALLN